MVQSVNCAHKPNKLSVSALSQELLDEIVDCLDGDVGSLRSLACTCRAFAPRAQRHLLRRIRLGVDSETLERAVRDFGSSTASAYVVELVLDFDCRFEPAFEAVIAPITPIFGSVKAMELRHLYRTQDEEPIVGDLIRLYSHLVDLPKVTDLVLGGLELH